MNSNRDKSRIEKVGNQCFTVAGKAIYGKSIDAQTRCEHYHSALDIIAIRFRCCDRYYPCYECHEETSDHPAGTWKKEEFQNRAVLCGACGNEMTISEYLSSEDTCPKCRAAFNPNCSKHYHLYFEL